MLHFSEFLTYSPLLCWQPPERDQQELLLGKMDRGAPIWESWQVPVVLLGLGCDFCSSVPEAQLSCSLQEQLAALCLAWSLQIPINGHCRGAQQLFCPPSLVTPRS